VVRGIGTAGRPIRYEAGNRQASVIVGTSARHSRYPLRQTRPGRSSGPASDGVPLAVRSAGHMIRRTTAAATAGRTATVLFNQLGFVPIVRSRPVTFPLVQTCLHRQDIGSRPGAAPIQSRSVRGGSPWSRPGGASGPSGGIVDSIPLHTAGWPTPTPPGLQAATRAAPRISHSKAQRSPTLLTRICATVAAMRYRPPLGHTPLPHLLPVTTHAPCSSRGVRKSPEGRVDARQPYQRGTPTGATKACARLPRSTPGEHRPFWPNGAIPQPFRARAARRFGH
jgi:hypothetical protein